MNTHERQPFADSSPFDFVQLRRWSADEYHRMGAAGIFAEGEHVELIGGEIVTMAPKGRHHEVLRNELETHFGDNRAKRYKIGHEPPLQLSDYDEPEPDIIVFPASLDIFEVRSDTVLLVVEVADSSLYHDLTTKCAMYATHGIREFWVVNARTRVTTVHRSPSANGYAEVTEVAPEQQLTPLLAPELAVRLMDLVIKAD